MPLSWCDVRTEVLCSTCMGPEAAPIKGVSVEVLSLHKVASDWHELTVVGLVRRLQHYGRVAKENAASVEPGTKAVLQANCDAITDRLEHLLDTAAQDHLRPVICHCRLSDSEVAEFAREKCDKYSATQNKRSKNSKILQTKWEKIYELTQSVASQPSESWTRYQHNVDKYTSKLSAVGKSIAALEREGARSGKGGKLESVECLVRRTKELDAEKKKYGEIEAKLQNLLGEREGLILKM